MRPAPAVPSPAVLTAYRHTASDGTAATLPPSPPPLLHIGNGAAPTTSANHASPAVQALSSQIHAVLNALAVTPSTPLGRRLTPALRDPQRPLDRTALLRLKRGLAALPPIGQQPARAQMLRTALYDLIRAADAELLLEKRIDRHAQHQAVNNRPGALQEYGTRGSLGAAVGLPGAVDLGLGASLGHSNSTSTFDDLAVARFSTLTLGVDATAMAGLPAAVGLDARLGGHLTCGSGEIADKMQDHVLALARASVARRLGGSALLRGFKRLTGPHRDRYAERVSRAMAWQPRLSMLLGTHAAGPSPAFHAPPPPPIDATLETAGGTLGAGVRFGVGELAVSAEASRTEVKIDLPVRLTGTDLDATDARGNAQIRDELDARVQWLRERAGPTRSRTQHLALQIGRTQDKDARLQLRLDAVAHLQAEFAHLERLSQHAMTAPRQAAAPLASLAHDWGGSGVRVEKIMVRMLDLLAWLQATPSPPAGNPALADWELLQARVQEVADRIHDTALPHDRQQVHRATHAFRQMIQRIATRQGTVRLTGNWAFLNASARASVARLEREDSDPLRAGTYLDVTLTGELAPSAAPLLEEVQRTLASQWGDLPLLEAQQTLTTLLPTFSGTGNARCVVRLFRPGFQDDPAFPAKARGIQLQTLRLSAGSSYALNVAVPLPVVPGVTVKVGLQHQRNEQVPQLEWFCPDTLTGALLRFKSLRTRDTDAATTWDQLLTLHGPDLDQLASALARPDAVAGHEARFWLRRPAPTAEVRKEQREGLAALAALRLQDTPAERRAQLFVLFNALMAATRRHTQASPLIGPTQLPPLPNR